MRAFLALLGRQIADSRWFLALAGLALFGFGWLFVFATSRIESRGGRIPRGFVTSGEIEVGLFWSLPPVLLPVIAWSIARGGSGVAGEIERGTLDLALSRPVSRTSFLGAKVVGALFGLAVLGACLLAGHLVGVRNNVLRSAPLASAVLRPVANLAALGLAIYGFTIFLSSLDRVAWRPNLAASAVTFAAFVAKVVAGIPVLESWKDRLEGMSIFTAYDPPTALMDSTTFGPHLLVLCGIGLGGIALAAIAFGRRDLPANS